MEKQDKLVLIDGNSLINRAFYALPLLLNSDGEYSNAVYGFCNTIIKLMEQEKPKYIAVAFDMGKPTFRHLMYADYKAGRKGMPEELASQMPILKKVLQSMNIKFVEKEGIEADDIIGTIAKRYDIETIIVSGDRDLFQLVDDTTTVWFTKKGVTETIKVTPQNIKEVYGVSANQVADLKAIMGDSSDNIKGVAGIGEKGAKDLINQYGSLDNIYLNIDNLKGKQKEKLELGKDSAYLSKTLATINTTVNIEAELDDLQYNYPFNIQTYNLFKKYEFYSLLKKPIFDQPELQHQIKNINKNIINKLQELNNLVVNLKQTTEFAVYMQNDKINIANSRFEENIICVNDNLPMQVILQTLQEVLSDKNINKIALNSKNLISYLIKQNIDIQNVTFDCNLAKYLLSGSKKTDLQADALCEEYSYNNDCIATCLLFAKDDLLKLLEQEEMKQLYFDIELPLVAVLIDMEQNGFKIDMQSLKTIGEQYKNQIDSLTKQIIDYAGIEFNIKSPKQVDDILFDRLALKRPKGKKSTDAAVLDKISQQHPIVNKILEFRKIEKLYSSYIEPFANLVDKNTGLIHTIFNQTLTSTGRLSSSEPNLQNIPIRDQDGKLLRKFFIPRYSDGCLVTSDYSQIELRLIAHYSQDDRLLYAYNNDIDIHSQTASDVFGLPLDMINDDLRRKAKIINFGIIYGMSDYGLSQTLLTTKAEAKQFIDSYFDTYSRVKDFMQSSINFAKEKGYVTTIFGRKRKIEAINSSSAIQRQFSERAAMNMPLQGSASELIKIAMIKVYNELKNKNLKSKLILTIHDELIVDCVKGEEQQVKDILKTCMESAAKLSVPLKVDIKSGKTWYDAK